MMFSSRFSTKRGRRLQKKQKEIISKPKTTSPSSKKSTILQIQKNHPSSGGGGTLQFGSAERWKPSFKQISLTRYTPLSSQRQKIKQDDKNRIRQFIHTFNIKYIGNITDFYKNKKWVITEDLKKKVGYSGAMADILLKLRNVEIPNKYKILKGI